MDDVVNHPTNKIITVRKKTTKNLTISKFLAKKTVNTNVEEKTQNSTSNSNQSVRIKLPLLFKNYLPLNDRTPAGKTLPGIRNYQVFNVN